jgi:hypothetical protein
MAEDTQVLDGVTYTLIEDGRTGRGSDEWRGGGEIISSLEMNRRLQSPQSVEKHTFSDLQAMTPEEREEILSPEELAKYNMDASINTIIDSTTETILRNNEIISQYQDVASLTPEQQDQLIAIKQENIDMTQDLQGLYGDKIDWLRENQGSFDEINKNILSQALVAQGHIDKWLEKPKSDLEQASAQVGLDLAENMQRALTGEGGVSEASRVRKQREFEKFREQSERSGHFIFGSSYDDAYALTTAGVQTLAAEKEKWTVAEDAERMGYITQGMGALSRATALESDINQRILQTSQGLVAGAKGVEREIPQVPYALSESMGLLGTAPDVGAAATGQAEGLLLSAGQAGYDPYARANLLSQQIEGQRSISESGRKSGLLGSLLQSAGYIGASYLGGPIGAGLYGAATQQFNQGYTKTPDVGEVYESTPTYT